MNYNVQRFIDAHNKYYGVAKQELSAGKKKSHYMWFIFPQIQGLGYSETAIYYAIENIDEAKAYLNNDLLKSHMEELINILLNLETSDAYDIFGEPDDKKFRSSLTLFKAADPENPIYAQALEKFFDGKEDSMTIAILNGELYWL